MNIDEVKQKIVQAKNQVVAIRANILKQANQVTEIEKSIKELESMIASKTTIQI